jgi:predicted nucleotidyltransferase
MATAQELAQTLRERSAEQQARADLRAQRLRAQLPKAARLLAERYQAKRVVLFGSLAAGTYSEQSDVDLAVEGMPSSTYFSALADLMGIFGGPVDLVRLEEAVPSLRACIEAEGRAL